MRFRRLKPTHALALVIAVALIGGACGDTTPKPAPTITGSDPISRASAFLLTEGAASDPAVPLMLSYLDRQWSLGYFAGPVDELLSELKRGDSESALYGRLLDPALNLGRSKTAEAAGILSPTMSPVVYLPLRALHCDRFPLPADFLAEVEAETRRGGYGTTHAVIALRWAIEQGCLTESQTAQLRSGQRIALIRIAESPATADMFAEALAMLYYGGHGDAVRAEWMETLVTSQRPDGSFPFDSNDLNPGHSTALALWAMLAAERPDVPPATWIPEPGPPATREPK